MSHYIAQPGLKLPLLCVSLQSVRFTGVQHHTQLLVKKVYSFVLKVPSTRIHHPTLNFYNINFYNVNLEVILPRDRGINCVQLIPYERLFGGTLMCRKCWDFLLLKDWIGSQIHTTFIFMPWSPKYLQP